MNTYLITGGAGFIGSHLAEYLIAAGDKVMILDDLSTGSVENIRHLKQSKAFECFFDSVNNKQRLAELVDESDVVFHLAAAVGVRLVVESPVRTIETNVNGTQLVLEAACRKKKLVFVASTSEVYGKNEKTPFSEDFDLVLGPTTKGRWSYAASKALDEFLALSYWREKNQPVVIARLFNTVGPRQTGRYGMVLPNFIGQALEGAPITVFGTGHQSRCFCDIKDTVVAIVQLVATSRALGEVVNIGSDEEVTIEDLARIVKDRARSSSPIVHVPYAEAYEPGFEDMYRRVPALEKLERLTGFRPKTKLLEIVDRTTEHFDKKRKLAGSARRSELGYSTTQADSNPKAFAQEL
jgi:nucleoside-diphosphate-sugar epimerase